MCNFELYYKTNEINFELYYRTVWYELLNGIWPFEQQPPESIIWQVGHGIKPSFGSIRGSKEVKVKYSLVCDM